MLSQLKTWLKQRPALLAIARALKRFLLVEQLVSKVSTGANIALLIYDCIWLHFGGRKCIPRASALPASPDVVMLVWAYLPADPRVEREARALARKGYRVKVICPEWSPPSPAPDWGERIEISLLPNSVTSTLADFPWVSSDGLLQAALAESPWAYHAHDLNTALTAMKAAAARSTLCICDFHEWYSENVTYDAKLEKYVPHSWIKRFVYQLTEHLALRCASRVITVCESISDELNATHKPTAPVAVIRNIPPIPKLSDESAPATDIRSALGIPSAISILLYQGGVGPSRGLEPLIKAMKHVKNAVLVIRGPGIEVFQPSYMALAEQFNAAEKVYFLPPVPSARCTIEATSADLGFWTLMPICKNFTYALPNKVFEYLAAGLPIVCAHHPEVKRLIDKYQVGFCFDPEDVSSIARAIDLLAGDSTFRSQCKARIPDALREVQADSEWEKLVQLYEDLQIRNVIPLKQRLQSPASELTLKLDVRRSA
jgi:glycosyltransferase involved in cell wall biosynthesis